MSSLLQTSLRQGVSGGCTIEKYIIKDKEIVVLWDYNQFHGDILRQWMIDGEDHTPERHTKYFGLSRVLFDCSNSICSGPFDGDSIVWEFFCKPLGLTSLIVSRYRESDGVLMDKGRVQRSDLVQYAIKE